MSRPRPKKRGVGKGYIRAHNRLAEKEWAARKDDLILEVLARMAANPAIVMAALSGPKAWSMTNMPEAARVRLLAHISGGKS